MIDYGLIQKSIDYYETVGFNRIETPWTITEAISNITKPPTAKNFVLSNIDKCLVASAEQGFLYLYLKGFLPKGKYQSTGPCFRCESFDELHTKYFIKNELISTENVSEKELDFLMDSSLTLFNMLFNGRCEVVSVESENSSVAYDIVCEGVELGSYGIRKCSFLKWVYGTGLAEPRTSNLMRQYGLSS